jgi:predicted ATPase
MKAADRTARPAATMARVLGVSTAGYYAWRSRLPSARAIARQARSGEGRVTLIFGEPGIGKSRLTAALSEHIGSEPHTRLRYFCSPHHQDSALYPVIAQLERAANFRRDDGPEAKLDKLAALLAPAAEAGDVSLLVELLSLPGGDRFAPLELSPQRKKERTPLRRCCGS